VGKEAALPYNQRMKYALVLQGPDRRTGGRLCGCYRTADSPLPYLELVESHMNKGFMSKEYMK